MVLSAVSVLVFAQSSSEIAEGLMNNPVYNGLFAEFKCASTSPDFGLILVGGANVVCL